MSVLTAPRSRLIVVASCLALVLAGCAGGGESGGDGATTNEQERTELVASAQQVLDTGAERPTEIAVTEPIGVPIPSDKTIGFVSCGADVCIELGNALTAAADALGWTTQIISTDGSVEQVSNAWRQLANSDVDAVYGSGYPREIFEGSLQQLEAKGVPVVMCCTVDEPGNGITVMQGQSADYGPLAELWAASVTVDSGAAGEVLYVSNPGFSTQEDMTRYFKEDLAEMCPDCTIQDLEIPLSAVGTESSNRIVSTLRANPDIKHVVVAYGGVTVGLPAALETAGLGDVKIIDQSATLQGYQYIATGEQLGTVVYPYRDSMWQAADTFARVFTDQPIDPSDQPPQFWYVDQDNLPGTGEYFPTVEGYQEQYKQLWGV